jgi:hypothetical protein
LQDNREQGGIGELFGLRSSNNKTVITSTQCVHSANSSGPLGQARTDWNKKKVSFKVLEKFLEE